MKEKYEVNYERKISKIYSKLFRDYSDEQFEDSIQLFFERFRKWKLFPLSWFEGKLCLDAGCGQGRYVVAMGRLGAQKVIGIDINDYFLEASKKRSQLRKLENVELRKGDVLDIPYPDNTFDFVVCSGVAQLTPKPKKAFDECTRVLKPSGFIYFCVYGKSFYWTTYGFLRKIARFIDFETLAKICEMIGIPANKRYNYLDNLYIPYCYSFSQEEVVNWFKEDYKQVKRLEPQEKHFMRFFGVKK